MTIELELKATEYTVADRIATVWLNRPHRMNAWTGRMHTEYRACLAEADADPNVGAIVVTGKGRGFCVGGDSQALAGHVKKGGYDPGTPAQMSNPGYGVAPEFDASFAYHYGLSKPIVAAMNGPAAGVGLALACFTDLRFAVSGAKFTTAHGKLNLPAEYGLSWLLPRMMGLTQANELLLSSRPFTSDEAVELGIVNRVLPARELLPYTYDYVQKLLVSVSPESLKQTRWQTYRDLHRDAATAVQDSEQLINGMMKQADFKEGVAALREKRAPIWGAGSD